MIPFELIKSDVTVPQAAERYGLSVGRNGMVRCLFHDDDHPSMKLNEKYYYCFGCGAHGDVIDLTARLLGTTAKEAAAALMDDFHLDTGRQRQQTTEYRRPAIKRFRQDEAECASVLAEFLHLLQTWKVQYAPVSPEDPPDDHYILACRELEKAEYVFDLLSVGTPEDRIKLVDELIRSGKIARLKRAIADIKQEDTDHGEHEEARAS